VSLAKNLSDLAEHVRALELEAADLRRENKRLRIQVARLTKENEPAAATTPDNPWQILGVAPGAPVDEVLAAFRRLSKQHHPDATTGDRVLFERIVSARDTLLKRVP
jgi:DnaJ-class molecular chaperone